MNLNNINMANLIQFPVGTRVEKIGCCYYSHSGDKSGIIQICFFIQWFLHYFLH